MEANIKKALESTSAIAIGQSISQVVSATIIPFRAPKQAEAPEELSPVDEEAHAEEVIAAIEADNDNLPAPPAVIEPVFGASALIERARLTRAVEIIGNVTEKRNTIPILSHLAMVGTGDALRLIGTDLDIEIEITIPAAADREFGTTLPAHLLKDLLKKATASDFVAITTGEDRDALDFERVNYHLQPLSLGDWPYLTGPDASATEFELPGKVFWGAIGATIGATSTEATRYYLNGIFIHSVETDDGFQIRMAATDGHRLYRQEIEAPEGFAGMPEVIIPNKTVSLLHKLMKGKACPDSVAISVTASKIRIAFDDIVVTSKLVDGTFPDYTRVIPLHNDRVAQMAGDTMLEAIRAVSLISSERGRAVKLGFADGNCQLVVHNPDSGSAIAHVACEYATDATEIGFNAGYLSAIILDAVGNGNSFAIKIADASSPAIVTGDRAGWLGVIMPMRV